MEKPEIYLIVTINTYNTIHSMIDTCSSHGFYVTSDTVKVAEAVRLGHRVFSLRYLPEILYYNLELKDSE